MNIDTLRQAIQQESAARIEIGTVIAADIRGTNSCAVRLSGGRVCTRTYNCVDGLQPGDEVIVAHLDGKDRLVIMAHIQDTYRSTLSNRSILAPPNNLVALGIPGGVWAEWDAYPGDATLCWQIQHHDSGSDDANATDAIVTMGSYFLYQVVDEDADLGTPVTRYFRVRAIRWLSDNNVMYSSWSSWTSGTSVTWDGRYYQESELSSASCDGLHGASLIWICDSDDNFPSNISTVELALDYLAEAGSAHNMFSATHTDTVAGAALRGYIPRGNATPAWERYDAKTNHFILVGDGNDITSKAFDWDDVAAGAGAGMAHDHSAAGEGGATLGFTAMTGAGVDVPDNWYIGLGVAAGRFVFDSTPAPDQILVHDADLDLQGNKIIIDSTDDDTYLISPADDQVDFYLAGALDFSFKPNVWNVLAGSGIQMGDATWWGLGAAAGRLVFTLVPAWLDFTDITVDLQGNKFIIDNTDDDTYLISDADDTVKLYLAGALDFSWTANAFNVLAGSSIVMADDTTIGQAAGPLLTFDDTLNNLVLTGGKLGLNVTPTFRLDVSTDHAAGYAAKFFNDGNNVNRYGIRVSFGEDDHSASTNYGVVLADGDDTGEGGLRVVNGTVEVYQVSDELLKMNVVPTHYGLAEILALNVVNFNWKKNPDGPMTCGFTAQDAEKVFPDMVASTPEGTLGTAPSRLIPLLVRAIQEQQAMIDVLQEVT